MAQSDPTKNKGPKPLFSVPEKPKTPDPKPLFPAPEKKDGPKPLFANSPPPAKKPPPPPVSEPGKAVFSNEEFLRMHREKEQRDIQLKQQLYAANKPAVPPVVPKKPGAPGKVLFADKAVGGPVTDPFYKNHPLCVKLSEKDIGRVRNIVMAAKVEDTAYVLNYADELRVRFTELIDGIIQEQTSGKTALVNDKIQELVEEIDKSKQLIELISNPPEKSSGLFRWIKQEADVPSVKDAIRRFQQFFRKVDSLVVELRSSVDTLVQLVNQFDVVFKNNQDNFTLLNLHVIAGRIITEKHNTKTIPEMEKKIDPTNIFEGQNVAYFKDSVNRFERKIDELERIAHSVILNAPAIRILQMGGKDKADRIQRISQSVVPTWKQQCSILIGALENSSATELSNLRSESSFVRKSSVIADLQKTLVDFRAALA